jgi:sugar-specific transcriptional regulator TrmB
MNNETLIKLKKYLEKLGLNDKDSKVYLFVLSHGPQLVSAIGKNCNLTRTHAYDIIKKLEQLGLCHSLGSEYGKKIKATSIDQISDLIEKKEEELLSLKKELKNIAPILESLTSFKPQTKNNTAYFSGSENLKKLINYSLQSEEKIINIAGSEIDLINKLGEEFMINYHERRKNKKVFLKALRPGDKKGANKAFINDLEYLREVKLRPEGEIKLKSNIIIWDSSVAIISLGDELFGTLIENEALALMIKSWFEFIWKKSKKI